jgi:arylsulfatase
MIFSADETADLGSHTSSPVADDYPDPSEFTCRIDWVQLDIGEDDHDHLISTDERLRVAMTRQ